jgi:hypothetical protein
LAVIEVFLERMALYEPAAGGLFRAVLITHNPGITSGSCAAPGHPAAQPGGMINALEKRELIGASPIRATAGPWAFT